MTADKPPKRRNGGLLLWWSLILGYMAFWNLDSYMTTANPMFLVFGLVWTGFCMLVWSKFWSKHPLPEREKDAR